MEKFTLIQSPFNLTGFAHDQIHGKRRWHFTANLECLIELIPAGHDHQNIHIAVRVRRRVGIGTEQDDLVGPEALGHLARELADDAHRDIGTAIPASRRRLR